MINLYKLCDVNYVYDVKISGSGKGIYIPNDFSGHLIIEETFDGILDYICNIKGTSVKQQRL